MEKKGSTPGKMSDAGLAILRLLLTNCSNGRAYKFIEGRRNVRAAASASAALPTPSLAFLTASLFLSARPTAFSSVNTSPVFDEICGHRAGNGDESNTNRDADTTAPSRRGSAS